MLAELPKPITIFTGVKAEQPIDGVASSAESLGHAAVSHAEMPADPFEGKSVEEILGTLTVTAPNSKVIVTRYPRLGISSRPTSPDRVFDNQL